MLKPGSELKSSDLMTYFLHHTKMLTAGAGPSSFFLVSVLFCPMSMRDREKVLYGVREGNEIGKEAGTETGK